MPIDAHRNGFSFVARKNPDLPLEIIDAYAADAYGLEGTFHALASERDQNYRIERPNGTDVVLKISARDETDSALAFQIAALEHIARCAPDLPVPRLIARRDETSLGLIEAPDGNRHLIHCLSWIDGLPIDDLSLDVGLRRDIGTMLARVGRALAGFHHPAAAQELPWHIALLPRLSPCLDAVDDKALRASLAQILDRHVETVAPALRRLRAQCIHHDANGPNLLVGDDGGLSGLIDFGDMCHAALACDVAVVGADLCDGDDMATQLCETVQAFDLVMPFEADEIDMLYDLVAARLCATLLIIAARNSDAQQDGYMAGDFELYVERLERWRGIGRHAANAALRRACGFAPSLEAAAPDLDVTLARRQERLGSSLKVTYGDAPVRVEAASGVWLHGPGGERLLDAYNNVPHVGHAHPRVVRAVARQSAALNTNTRYLFGNILDYADRLAALCPPELGTATFVNSGSEANDAAYSMARHATDHDGIIVMEHAWHGITRATADMSPSGHGMTVVPPHVRTLRAPDAYRVEADDLIAECLRDVDRAIADLAASPHGLACFVIDTGFVSNGILDIAPDYLQAVVARVHAAGGLVIADEVQMGLGRSGDAFWGYERHGIAPDFITLGKPVANGYPLGVVLTSRDLRDDFGAATDFFSTFGGNPVACAAGLAVLDVMEDEGLQANAKSTGAYMRDCLRALGQRHEVIGDVRGFGLLCGVEIITDRKTRAPASDETLALIKQLRLGGVLIGREGPHGNVFKIRPPMPFQRTHVDQLVETLDSILSERG